MEQEFVPTENRGVKLGMKPSDFMAGVNSGVPYFVRIESGNWNDPETLPTYETQWGSPGGDKMNCVTQSGDNTMESQLMFDRKHNTQGMTDRHWQWLKDNGFLDENGKPNINDRVCAILNGTTHDGNWLYKAADSWRGDGIFPESLLPSDESLSWDEYYNRVLVTPEIIRIGQESKNYFEIRTEFIPATKESLLHHLKQAPIQVVFPNHAVSCIRCPADVEFLDTYNPFIKTIPLQYLQAAMKILITPKELTMNITVKKCVINGTVFGALIDTPNGVQIIKATDEAMWRSWNKADSYGLSTVNNDGSTNWDQDSAVKITI